MAELFLGLAFTAGAASGGDNAAFVSYSDVPSTMMPGGTATVTVTMRNTGTTTWKSKVVTETDGSTLTRTTTIYLLDAVGQGWGVSGVAVPGSVAPNATHSFEFTITAPETRGNYTFQWQMSRDTVVITRPTRPRTTNSFGAVTTAQTIMVGPDTAPSFGNGRIPNQEWLRGSQIEPVTLPGATGGNGALSYSLVTCYLPGGVTYDRARKRISGTPRTAWGPTPCTWKVTDSDDNTAASDADTLTFTIWVKRPVLTLSATEPDGRRGRHRDLHGDAGDAADGHGDGDGDQPGHGRRDGEAGELELHPKRLQHGADGDGDGPCTTLTSDEREHDRQF